MKSATNQKIVKTNPIDRFINICQIRFTPKKEGRTMGFKITIESDTNPCAYTFSFNEETMELKFLEKTEQKKEEEVKEETFYYRVYLLPNLYLKKDEKNDIDLIIREHINCSVFSRDSFLNEERSLFVHGKFYQETELFNKLENHGYHSFIVFEQMYDIPPDKKKNYFHYT